MIVPIIKRGDASSYHRIELPLRHMNLWQDEFQTSTLDELFKKASIVYFNRVFPFDLTDLLRYRKKYGFRILLDIDDYWILPPRHIAYKAWKDLDMTQRSLEAMMNSDFVFTTNKRLANRIKEYNPHVEVIPNAIPFGWEQFTSTNNKSDQIRFVYAGANTHFWDIRIIQNAIKKLKRDKVKEFEIYYAGENKLPLDRYMVHYEEANVSLAPLEDNYFNSFKSQLKLLEAGCKYIPLIASDFPPYSDEPNNIIIRATSTNDWYKYMKYCIENRNYVEDMGEKTGEYVRAHYDLYEVNKKRNQIFNYLLNK